MPMDSEWPKAPEETDAPLKESNGLGLNEIRLVAKEHGFEEWFYCSAYGGIIQVAAFRKQQADGDVIKIQVYPKTHAVSVCNVHHEKEKNDERNGTNEDAERTGEMLSTNKKSLYVVQVVDTVQILRDIFSDPLEYGKDLIYTRRDNLVDRWSPPVSPSVKDLCGNCSKPPVSDEKSLLVCTRCKSVAYCDRNCQRANWKAHKRECSDCTEFDVTRRCIHVAIVSGLTTDREDLGQIRNVYQLFDSLLFEPDGPPCLCRSRYACGSICALSNMLLEIARTHHDVIGITSHEYAWLRFRGQVEKEERYRASFHPCIYHDEFMDEFEPCMKDLENQIIALKPHIRCEVVQFLFERMRCEEKITMIDSNEMPLMKKEVTFPIHFANSDYSRLVYGDDADEHMCFAHGTFYRSEDDDDVEDDEQSDAGTERTAEESEDDDDDESE